MTCLSVTRVTLKKSEGWLLRTGGASISIHNIEDDDTAHRAGKTTCITNANLEVVAIDHDGANGQTAHDLILHAFDICQAQYCNVLRTIW